MSLLQVAPIMLAAKRNVTPLAFVSSTTVSGNSAATIAKPSGAQAGDILVILVAHGSYAMSAAGFTPRGVNSSGAVRLTEFTRQLDGSEGSTFSITGGEKIAIALLYRGGSASFDVAATPSQATSATQTAASITATQPGALISGFITNQSIGVSITTPPAGMTQRNSTISNNSLVMTFAVFDLLPSLAGATGAKSLVWSGGANAGAAGSLQIY